MPDDIERIAYDAALRALDKQERILEELRTRTGIVLAASSLAVSFLSRSASQSSTAVVAVAATLFALTIAASIYVLLPKSIFYFAVSGRAILEELYEFRADVGEIQRRLVYDMQRFWDHNDAAMQKLFRAFTIAALALVAEVALLLTAVSGNLF